jgi:hypothetical protein
VTAVELAMERTYLNLCALEQPTRQQQAHMTRLQGAFRRRKVAWFSRPALERRLFGASRYALQAACAAPMNKYDFMARIDARHPDVFSDHAVQAALRWLEHKGWLISTGWQAAHTGQSLKLYTLTPAGEEVLDELWRAV